MLFFSFCTICHWKIFPTVSGLDAFIHSLHICQRVSNPPRGLSNKFSIGEAKNLAIVDDIELRVGNCVSLVVVGLERLKY